MAKGWHGDSKGHREARLKGSVDKMTFNKDDMEKMNEILKDKETKERKNKREKTKLQIQKVSMPLYVRKTWTTIDNDRNYRNWMEVYTQNGITGELELTESYGHEDIMDAEEDESELGTLEQVLPIENYEADELIAWLDENKIKHNDGEYSNWVGPDIDNAYGVKYERISENMEFIIEGIITENQIRWLKKEGWDVEEI